VKEGSPQNQILRLLFWEATIKCNLNCAHCRRLESDEAVITDLSTSQGKDLIGQLAQLGRAQPMMPVLVFSGGEPLCRYDIFELIDLARSSGLVPALATNGTMIDAATAQKIADSGIARVAVSIDGATAEVHDRLRKQEGSFERALEGIRHLHDKEIPFQINITLTKHNAAQLEDVYELAKSVGAVALSPQEYEEKLVEISRLDSKGQLQVKVTCGPHYERVIREQGLYQSRKKAGHSGGSVPGRDGHGTPSKGCLAGLGVLFVGHQGDVFPCGYLPINCGNILKKPLAEIWYKSSDLARMRDSSALEGKCGVCGYRQVCGGCRARAYGATGNYMAEEPFCAYIPPDAVSKG